MANTQQKDLFTQVRDLGSDALNRLSDVPGGSKLVDFVHDTRNRLEEMQKKVRGIDALEQRVATLERQVAALERKPAARKPATPKKPPAAPPA
jgi:polyhydroxyalkanoate synthesis regulator phasin